MTFTADEIKKLLELEPHPTCGFVTRSYLSDQGIPAGALPPAYNGSRPYASVLSCH